MEWIKKVNHALSYIEKNLDDEISDKLLSFAANNFGFDKSV